MIRKLADRKQNHFVEFHHQEDRMVALEADIEILCKDMLSYLENWRSGACEAEPGERLVSTLRRILSRLEQQ